MGLSHLTNDTPMTIAIMKPITEEIPVTNPTAISPYTYGKSSF